MLYKSHHILISVICCAIFLLLTCEKDKPTKQTGKSYVTWQKTIGGEDYDGANCVISDTDCGCLIAGSTQSFGAVESDVYIIKIDSIGDTMWTRMYGKESSDKAYSVCETSDNCYLILGSSLSLGVGRDIYLLKVDSLGDTIWTKNYGIANNDERSYILNAFDDGYIIVGSSQSFIYIQKMNQFGDSIWTKTIDKYYSSGGFSAATTSAGYYLTGWTMLSALGNYDVCIAKTDLNGDTIWVRSYDNNSYWEFGCSIVATPDGGCIAAGQTADLDHGGNADFYLIRLDSLGDCVWIKTYGGDRDDEAFSIKAAYDGCYIVCGRTKSYGAGEFDVILIKIDNSGNVIWRKTYGTVEHEYAYSVDVACDGGYIVAGNCRRNSQWDVYVLKTDPNGNL